MLPSQKKTRAAHPRDPGSSAYGVSVRLRCFLAALGFAALSATFGATIGVMGRQHVLATLTDAPAAGLLTTVANGFLHRALGDVGGVAAVPAIRGEVILLAVRRPVAQATVCHLGGGAGAEQPGRHRLQPHLR